MGKNRLYKHSRMAGLTLPGAARGQQKHFSKYLFLSCFEVRAGRNTIKKWGYKRIQIKWQKYSFVNSSSKSHVALSNTMNSSRKDYCLCDLREIETTRQFRSYTSSYADSFIKHSTLVWLKEETFLYITKLEQSKLY